MNLSDKLINPAMALRDLGKVVDFSKKGISYLTINESDAKKMDCSLICEQCHKHSDEIRLVFDLKQNLCPECFFNIYKNEFINELRKRLQYDITAYIWYLAHFDKEVEANMYEFC